MRDVIVAGAGTRVSGEYQTPVEAQCHAISHVTMPFVHLPSLLGARLLDLHGDLKGLHGSAAAQTRDGCRIARIQSSSKAHITFRWANAVCHVEANPSEPFHPRLGPGVVCISVRSLLQHEITRDVTRRYAETTCSGNEDVCVVLADALAVGEGFRCTRMRIGNPRYVLEAIGHNADQLVKPAKLILAAHRAGEIVDRFIGPGLRRLAQVNALRSGMGEVAHDSIAVLRLDGTNRFDVHLLV